jgi:hypothetical protein
MRRVLIVGATSPLARYMAHEFAKQGDALFLAARDEDELQRVASDVRIRYGAIVHTGHFDAVDIETHEAFWQQVVQTMDGLDGVVWVAGSMDGLEEAFCDPSTVRRLIDVNFTGAASLLTLAACYFEQRGSGFIAGVSSVAGDRGRGQNYPYGAAKGGLAVPAGAAQSAEQERRAGHDHQARFHRYAHDVGAGQVAISGVAAAGGARERAGYPARQRHRLRARRVVAGDAGHSQHPRACVQEDEHLATPLAQQESIAFQQQAHPKVAAAHQLPLFTRGSNRSKHHHLPFVYAQLIGLCDRPCSFVQTDAHAFWMLQHSA